jgi:hypothetical protein
MTEESGQSVGILCQFEAEGAKRLRSLQKDSSRRIGTDSGNSSRGKQNGAELLLLCFQCFSVLSGSTAASGRSRILSVLFFLFIYMSIFSHWLSSVTLLPLPMLPPHIRPTFELQAGSGESMSSCLRYYES